MPISISNAISVRIVLGICTCVVLMMDKWLKQMYIYIYIYISFLKIISIVNRTMILNLNPGSKHRRQILKPSQWPTQMNHSQCSWQCHGAPRISMGNGHVSLYFGLRFAFGICHGIGIQIGRDMGCMSFCIFVLVSACVFGSALAF